TKDERYWPAVGTMRPRPSVFIVDDPIELALQPDLCVLLSNYRVLAETPDYVVFDLTRHVSPTGRATTASATASATGYFYRFPPAWRHVERGMTKPGVLRVLGRPSRTEVRRDLRKPVETWFYGPNAKFVIVFVDGALFVEAEDVR